MTLLGVHGEGYAGGDEDHGGLDGMDARLDLAQWAEVQRHGDLGARRAGGAVGEGSEGRAELEESDGARDHAGYERLEMEMAARAARRLKGERAMPAELRLSLIARQRHKRRDCFRRLTLRPFGFIQQGSFAFFLRAFQVNIPQAACSSENSAVLRARFAVHPALSIAQKILPFTTPPLEEISFGE